MELEPILVSKQNELCAQKAEAEPNLPVLDLLRHGQESLLDIGGVLGRSLQERNTELIGEFL